MYESGVLKKMKEIKTDMGRKLCVLNILQKINKATEDGKIYDINLTKETKEMLFDIIGSMAAFQLMYEVEIKNDQAIELKNSCMQKSVDLFLSFLNDLNYFESENAKEDIERIVSLL